jgi:hypothetical protein
VWENEQSRREEGTKGDRKVGHPTAMNMPTLKDSNETVGDPTNLEEP